MSKIETKPDQWEAGVIKSVIQLLCWTGIWVISILMLSIGPQHFWNYDTTLTMIMVLINAAIGIALIFANIRHVKAQDEMQQRIFLESTALTAGVTLMFAGSYQLWGDIKLISFEPQVWHVVALMGLAQVITTIVAVRRYK